ncbi:MAG: adenylyl-sulfate kinase [Xanthomonadales bacterium]|nr:adenylyl-sulfate kinase [Xanthomonadales bacterium]
MSAVPASPPAPALPPLRLAIIGSVDDGKSTLLGRLLADCGLVPEDQWQALLAECRRRGLPEGEIEYAWLNDGLEAEREQGITIDVAWRYFRTARRVFIVADCPGHEQYTRNMASGLSRAELAVLLIDASRGVTRQTLRHLRIAALFGVPGVLLAVNKMDRVGFSRERFEELVAPLAALARELRIPRLEAIPIAAREGENLLRPSARLPWHGGPSLLAFLESYRVPPPAREAARLAVSLVLRAEPEFRGYAGTLAGGGIALGDEVVVLPSGQRSRVAEIRRGFAAVPRAGAGDAVVLRLADERDVGRGDVIAAARAPLAVADQFAAQLLWLDEEPLLPGRRYWLRLATLEVGAQVTEIRHRIEIESGQRLAARRLEAGEIAHLHLAADRPIPFAPFAEERPFGAFLLVDRERGATVAAGAIEYALRRATNVHWQPVALGAEARARIKGQRPRCLWFTGLPAAGKSTVADLLEQRLHALGYHTMLLDGDNLRHGLNRDLGFTPEDRVENIRRVAEVARLMCEAGLIVLVSLVSPYRADRAMARSLFRAGEFVEVFVDVPPEVAAARDPKGLYAKARAGLIPNFTGVNAPYEPPEAPEIRLPAAEEPPERLAERVLAYLLEGSPR